MSSKKPDPGKAIREEMPFPQVKKMAAPLLSDGKEYGQDLIEEGETQLVLFEKISIRKVFHENEWHFSIIDVIAALTESATPRKYWSDLKTKLIKEEGFSELSDKIGQLPLMATDGKMRETDTTTVETIFRIIQSIPSRKAEPFKRWLAKVGHERIQEIQDPEIAVKRAILSWQAQGRTNDWIEARLRSIVVRKELTDQWQRGGIEGPQYGALTNVISKATFDVDVKQHMNLKGLKPRMNLRDHMTDLELVFTMLGEKSTSAIAKAVDAKGFMPNISAAHSGGRVAGDARRDLERQLKASVVSRENFLEDGERKNDPQKLTRRKDRE